MLFSASVKQTVIVIVICDLFILEWRIQAITNSTRIQPKSDFYRKENVFRRLCRKCQGNYCDIDTSRLILKAKCHCKPTCLHESQCENGVCQCQPGFIGKDCGVISDKRHLCSSLQCQNGGICINYGEEGNHCSCPVNFTGLFCQTPVLKATTWCQKECNKRNRLCQPSLFKKALISFTCLSVNQCQKSNGCKNGFCEVNNTNNCICNQCWHGKLCDEHCCKTCLNGGKCVKLRGREACDCPASFTGDKCEQKRTEDNYEEIPSTAYIYILITAAVVLCVLLVTLVVVPYTLWKKRVLWIMKIVYRFQPPIDPDSKEYHAFVSYCGSTEDGRKSPDEQFVLNKLQKKLEDEYKFRLCLHYRDFVPGIAIAENIINAVEKSHRTILILSRRFVESEWCQLEYQKAQHEMLLRRHRIIPIMLEQFDSSEIKDKNLTDILKAVTYIVWPSDGAEPKKLQHFWKKLAFSMPKRNGRKLENYPSTSSADTELSDLELQEDLEFQCV